MSPVGPWEKKARNLRADVKVVQRLLKRAAQALQAPQLYPKGVDGRIARAPDTSNTVTAIEAFQSRFTSSVDGLVEPDSQTWHALLEAAGELDQPDVSSEPGGFSFPFPTLPAFDWIEPPRAFASNRSNGARAHAGCDLYFENGTWIYAVADGIVTRGPYPFYCETFALEVDHGDFLARYGEISHSCEARRSGASGAANRQGWAPGRYSSPKRYVALGAVRQECFGAADNHGCGEIKEKTRRHSVYASNGSDRSYSQTKSVAESAPASLGTKV